MIRRLLIVPIAFVWMLALGAYALHAATVWSFESLTVAATSVGLTATTLQPTGQFPVTACSMRLETAQIRFREDGTASTAAEGTLLEVGDVLELPDASTAANIRFIRTGAVSGVLKVRCWR